MRFTKMRWKASIWNVCSRPGWLYGFIISPLDIRMTCAYLRMLGRPYSTWNGTPSCLLLSLLYPEQGRPLNERACLRLLASCSIDPCVGVLNIEQKIVTCCTWWKMCVQNVLTYSRFPPLCLPIGRHWDHSCDKKYQAFPLGFCRP